MTQTYTITGMTCNGCKISVEKSLNAIAGIVNTSVSLEQSEAVIEMSTNISKAQLQKALPKKFLISESNEKPVSELNSKVLKGHFQQLKPLFIIFGYITIASVLLHLKQWRWPNFMLDFMGLFYIVFSFFKLLDIKGFSQSFSMYDPLAKRMTVYGLVYPFLEVTLGLLFLFRIQIPLALIGTLVMLTITTVGIVKSLKESKTIECACLGSVLKLPMTKATFIENAIMIVMAILMLLNIF